MVNVEQINALLNSAKNYWNTVLAKRINNYRYGVEDCECSCNTDELIHELIDGLQYQVDLNLFTGTTQLFYDALLELVGNTGTPVDDIMVTMDWGYSVTNPQTQLDSNAELNYQYTSQFNKDAGTRVLDFSNNGSGKYLFIRQLATETPFTNWQFTALNAGTFSSDSVFKDPLVKGDYRYYLSRQVEGVSYELGNKFTLTHN